MSETGHCRTPGHAEPAPRDTRERLIEAISSLGPVTARRLAEEFGLTGAAVRRHLAGLEADGIIEEHAGAPVKRGRGRPSKSYVLSAAAHRGLEHEYEDVARMALDLLRERCGESALADLGEERVSAWAREFEARVAALPGGGSPEERIDVLAALLTERGYACTVRPVAVTVPAPGDGSSTRTLRTAQFVQGHCPIRDVAARHPVLCEVETRAISRMLGVPTQRLATLAGGAHACTTHISLTEGRTP